MERPHPLLDVERLQDVFCVRLRQPRLEESDIFAVADALLSLVEQEGCRKLVLSLGPEEPNCLYSVFLAKLVTLQRRLQACGGALKIAEASDDTIRIFEACRLKNLFDFQPTRAAAVAALQ
jgi:hypothetical protein